MALTRSEQMSRIRGTNTTPELVLRSELHRRGVRYRLNRRLPFGRPDLVLPGRRALIFVDGCFWHGCPEHYVAPKSRVEFWSSKLRTNVERDQRQTQAAESDGWKVLRLWEHELKVDPAGTADWVVRALAGQEANPYFRWQVIEVRSTPAGEARTLVELRGRIAPRKERSSLARRA